MTTQHDFDASQRPPTAAIPPTASPAGPRRKRRWVWPVAAAFAFFLGIGVGGAGGSGDPTASEEYVRVAAERDDLRDAVETAEERADDATSAATEKEAALEARADELDALSGELDSRQGDLEAREAAVTATENQIAATQIKNGVWTVGVDIEPGTYRTAEPVTSMCYWAILRSGTNGSDIVDNDLPEGGFPTVTLSTGQDFDNSCGVWSKQ